jgi:hypothetical protein
MNMFSLFSKETLPGFEELQAFIEGDTVSISSKLTEYHGLMMDERTFGPVLAFAKEVARIPGAVVQGFGLGMDI